MDHEKEVIVTFSPRPIRTPTPWLKRSDTPYIVIGIDFGTTYSGAAWARSGSLDTIEVISNWGSQYPGATDSEKVPSEITYDAYDKPAKWGFGLQARDEPLRWIKLLLSPSSLEEVHTTDNSYADTARRHLQSMEKSPVDVVSDYLRLLWSHILDRLKIRLSAPVLDNMLLKIVLTVPAIWDHDAQEKMRLAAKQAGMLQHRFAGETVVNLVAEPAAAALATYFDSDIRHNPIIRTGDSFVVCDAGGGTVDLISYTVRSFEPFRLTECISATGELCGAVYLDRAFLRLVRTLRSKHMSALSPDAERNFMEREWESNVKKAFDGSEGPWPVQLPQLPKQPRLKRVGSILRKEESNILSLTGHHLMQVFNEVVPKIVDLLKDQVEGVRTKTGSRPKVIILVGGFGANRYLLSQIERNFSPHIIIQQPSRAWSAVSRGAVHRGIRGGDDIVVNHIAKYSYGVKHQTPWEGGGKFLEDDKRFDERRRKWFARNQVKWYLRKHDDVQMLREVVHTFKIDIQRPSELQIVKFQVWFSDKDNPGERICPHVRELCNITADMSSCPISALPVFVNELDVAYRVLTPCLKMAVTVSSINWTVTFGDGTFTPEVVYCDNNSSAISPT